MSTYSLYLENDETEHEVSGTSPAKALRTLCALAGLDLASQSSRYGRTTDGRSVAALTVDAGRRRYADHGTTRFDPKEM